MSGLWLHSLATLFVIVAAGCGAHWESSSDSFAQVANPEAPNPKAKEQAAPAAVVDAEIGRQADAPPADAEHLRRIVHTAESWMVVEIFEGIPEKVTSLVEKHNGIVAHSQVQGQSGSPRSAIWTIRIPVHQYDDFVKAAHALGELRKGTSDSRDVSEQYYDVEARIRNKRVEETRLLKHLEETTGKLEDILAVERELARVREELERMEGRMRVLKDLTALTTVTLHVDEIKGYVPAETPTFTTRVMRAFDGSLQALTAFGEGLFIAGVAVVPWLVVLALPAAILMFAIRRRMTKT